MWNWYDEGRISFKDVLTSLPEGLQVPFVNNGVMANSKGKGEKKKPAILGADVNSPFLLWYCKLKLFNIVSWSLLPEGRCNCACELFYQGDLR